MRSARRFRAGPAELGLVALLVIAAVNFFWQIGSSSYYVDEVLALETALTPLHALLHVIETNEISPPAYFFFLHEWTGHVGASPEWVTRLPSALCGIALVGAIYWLATLVSERRAVAVGSAALAALSPFVLAYAQRTEEYVFAMLASTVAIAASIAASRARSRAAGRWLAAGTGAAVLALWLHYTAGLVLLPLCAWVGTRPSLVVRQRAGFVSTIVVAGAILVPILVRQHEQFPTRSGVAASAKVTGTTLVQLLEVPFDGRVDGLRALGVAVTVAALAIAAVRGRKLLAEPALIFGIAVGVPLAVIVLSLFGADLMLPRYVAVAVPVMIVAIATAVVSLPRVLAIVLAAALLACAIVGLVDNHRTRGFYMDARGVVRYIRAHERRGDRVLMPSSPGATLPLTYYGISALGAKEAVTPAGVRLLLAHDRRLWLVVETHQNVRISQVESYERPQLTTLRYRIAGVHLFPASIPLAVVLVVPTA